MKVTSSTVVAMALACLSVDPPIATAKRSVTADDDQVNSYTSDDTDDADRFDIDVGGEDEDEDDSTPFKHFIAHNKTMTCTADEHATPFNNQVRGVNLGGWMVLEPWITPTLFYQFIGGNENNTAMDTYTFCKVLGPKEANKQLRRHWEAWVTEDILDELASTGAVNSLRLPVGDYMYKPYGPYREYTLPSRNCGGRAAMMLTSCCSQMVASMALWNMLTEFLIGLMIVA